MRLRQRGVEMLNEILGEAGGDTRPQRQFLYVGCRRAGRTRSRATNRRDEQAGHRAHELTMRRRAAWRAGHGPSPSRQAGLYGERTRRVLREGPMTIDDK